MRAIVVADEMRASSMASAPVKRKKKEEVEMDSGVTSPADVVPTTGVNEFLVDGGRPVLSRMFVDGCGVPCLVVTFPCDGGCGYVDTADEAADELPLSCSDGSLDTFHGLTCTPPVFRRDLNRSSIIRDRLYCPTPANSVSSALKDTLQLTSPDLSCQWADPKVNRAELSCLTSIYHMPTSFALDQSQGVTRRHTKGFFCVCVCVCVCVRTRTGA
jgi:hypothetical protein